MKLIMHRNRLSRERREIRESFHQNDCTIILDMVPESSVDTLNYLFGCMTTDRSVPLGVGVAVVHPHDQFCRKVGLALASSRITTVNFRISHISRDGESTLFTLVGEGYIIELEYSFRTKYPKINDLRILRGRIYGTQVPARE